MWRRRKSDLTATRYRCALLPCNKVFAIPELLDLIMSFVHAHGVWERLKYGSVCHHWKSFFGPYIWEHVNVYRKSSLLNLRIHGPRVKFLNCYQVDRPVFDTLLQYVYNVECAYYFLDSHSVWITYRHFEQVFEAQQDRLTRLVLTVDFYTIDPRMLWSLSRLKLLNVLFLHVRKAADLAMVCIQALQCCPALTTFRVTSRESFLERRGRGRNVEILKTRIARAVMERVDGDRPTTLQEALARKRNRPIVPITTVNQLFQRTTPQLWQDHSNGCGRENNNQHKNLRNFTSDCDSNSPLFLKVVAAQCANVPNITIHTTNVSMNKDHWFAFSAACPQLQDLSFYARSFGQYPVNGSRLTELFPRLTYSYLTYDNEHIHWSAAPPSP